MEKQIVAVFSKYAGDESSDLYKEKGTVCIYGHLVSLVHDIETWERTSLDRYDMEGAVYRVESVDKDVLKRYPFVIEHLNVSGFYNWFIGVSGMSAEEEKNVKVNGRSSRFSETREYPNSYLRENYPQVGSIALADLNKLLSDYDIRSIGPDKVVVKKMVGADLFNSNLDLKENVPEAVAIAIAYGLPMEITLYDISHLGKKMSFTVSFDDLMKRF